MQVSILFGVLRASWVCGLVSVVSLGCYWLSLLQVFLLPVVPLLPDSRHHIEMSSEIAPQLLDILFYFFGHCWWWFFGGFVCLFKFLFLFAFQFEKFLLTYLEAH